MALIRPTTTFALGAAAAGLGVVAAVTASPAVGVVAALVGVVAWYFDHTLGATTESELEKRAANAERKLAEVEERLDDRKFNDDQTDRLLGELRNGWLLKHLNSTKDPRCPIVIVSSDEDPETIRFGRILAKLFEESGWPTGHEIWSGRTSSEVPLTISHGGAGNNACVEHLFRVFESVGMAPKTVNGDNEAHGDAVMVRIGRKLP